MSLAKLKDANQELTLRFSLIVGQFRVASFHHGNDVGARFSSSIFGASEDVAAAQRDRDGRLLNRRRLLPTFLENSHQNVAFKAVVLKLISFRVRNVLG